jgi:hypothetical protein
MIKTTRDVSAAITLAARTLRAFSAYSQRTLADVRERSAREHFAIAQRARADALRADAEYLHGSGAGAAASFLLAELTRELLGRDAFAFTGSPTAAVGFASPREAHAAERAFAIDAIAYAAAHLGEPITVGDIVTDLQQRLAPEAASGWWTARYLRALDAALVRLDVAAAGAEVAS